MRRLPLRLTDLIHQTREGTDFIGRMPKVKGEEEVAWVEARRGKGGLLKR